MTPAQRLGTVLRVEPDCPQLAELVRINDTLSWSYDVESFLAAVEIVKDAVGASLSPTYVVHETGTELHLIASEADRAALGDRFDVIPASEHLRAPWLNKGEWPVSARAHLDHEGWLAIPEDFRAWFGESGIVVHLHADDRHLGAVLLCFDGDYVLTPPIADFLAIAGRILGAAIYRWQTALREREVGALEERRRLSEELHDDLSQQVANLGLRTELTKLDLAHGDTDVLRVDLEELDDLVGRLKKSLRHEMLGLRVDARTVDRTFLTQVHTHLETFQSQLGVPTRLECNDEVAADQIPIELGVQLLRVLQEALSNAYRHAGTSPVRVGIRATSTAVRLEVEDAGPGFEPGAIPDSHLGVRIMRQRMQQVDGTLDIRAAMPHGAIVVAEAPIRHVRPVPVPVAGHFVPVEGHV